MPSTPTTPEVQNDPFIQEIQNKLLSQSEVVSSATTNIEDTINKAIGGVKTATEAEAARIQSEFGRDASYQIEGAKAKFQDFNETRTGFGTQMAAFRTLVQTTDKEMKDLEMRKEELLLANDAAGASKIADLQVKALEFKQKAQQDLFNNLLGTANFALQASGEKRAAAEFKAEMDFKYQQLALDKKQLDNDTQAKMAAIATEYGVTIEDGDTLESVVNKAQPQASAEAKARLSKLVAETAKLYEKKDKDLADVQFDQDLTDLIVNQGKSPTEAAILALQALVSLGIEPTKDDYNKAQQRAKEIAAEFKTQSELAAATEAPGWFEKFLGGAKNTISEYGRTGGGFNPSGKDPLNEIFGF